MLRVSDLVRSFGSHHAVDGLSFDASVGEIVGLLGPNGAGKTTTLLCLCGLLRPTSGRIELDGRSLGPGRGGLIALVPETPEVYPMLSVWEHLIFVARSLRLERGWEQRATGLLERLGLLDAKDVLGQALSKGMRQKTLLAATLLARPPVLLLDEPMIGLDPRGQRELRGLILELRGEGVAVVMSTHMLEAAEALCDRVVIMKAGRSIASGPISELRSASASGRTLEDLFLEITA